MLKRLSTGSAIVLAVALTSAAGCGIGTGTPAGVEDRLTQIAEQAGRPIYYLGGQFRDWALTDVSTESGRIYLVYGSCPAIVDSCAPPLQVSNEELEPAAWELAEGCSRLPPVRGVPAVNFGDALVLLTGNSLITVAPAGGDLVLAVAAAEELRPVDGDLSGAALPPPDVAALQSVDAACGQNPGDAGRPMPDAEGPEPTRDMRVPDFTVGRLGGGNLEWAAYRGRPVVIVVGDVPHVVSGLQRVRDLSATAELAVIGLVWKPFGSKEAPAPIAEVEQEVGDVSVPVGYAAIPRPAVWFVDMAQTDPAEAGVIAFVDAEGILTRQVRTDAGDDVIRSALEPLAR